ncbi:hypothetical protein Zmor_003673 [Zophobas morio]|uniref:Uncharacterized protein n=1 Tax=Zophobas morio TaxID=2755281 RepID=A0AA38M1V8_9CUCU|nr:hypothetical protein Zmor_003673 [Zophobas morio]
MENIVGRNVASMEHQLKSELEKSVECIEDRMKNKMKKFEKIMRNATTTSPCNVMMSHRTIQPPTYDGQTPWSSYKKQFETAATTNLWEEEQKVTALVIALRSAEIVLQTFPEEDRDRYSALSAALELRLGNEHLRQVFATQVETKTQKVGESFQEFEAGVKRLVRLASCILRRITKFSREACYRNVRKWHSRR